MGTSAIGATLDLGTSLLDDVVGAQLLEHVGQHRVVGQVGVEHLLELVVGRITRGTQHEGRQGRNLLAQISARRLAGRRRGDVDEVVSELEDLADVLAEPFQGGDDLR